MRPYLAILRARFAVLARYRAAAVAGAVTQIFFGLIHMMVYGALYEAGTTTAPLSQAQVVDYIWLGQASFTLLPWSIDGDLRTMMRSGGVVFELVRPLDLYWAWFARGISQRVAPALLRAVPMLVVAYLFLGFEPPASAAHGVGWLAALFGSILLGTAITNIAAISMLWTIGSSSPALLISLVTLLSGFLVPISFFPDWIQPLVRCLPFHLLLDAPSRLYTASLPASAAPGIVLEQLAWCAVLILLGRRMLARGVRALVVQGG